MRQGRDITGGRGPALARRAPGCAARRALHDRCALTKDCRRLHDVACETLRRCPEPDPTAEGMRTAAVDAPDLGSLILALRGCLPPNLELTALVGKKKCRGLRRRRRRR